MLSCVRSNLTNTIQRLLHRLRDTVHHDSHSMVEYILHNPILMLVSLGLDREVLWEVG